MSASPDRVCVRVCVACLLVLRVYVGGFHFLSFVPSRLTHTLFAPFPFSFRSLLSCARIHCPSFSLSLSLYDDLISWRSDLDRHTSLRPSHSFICLSFRQLFILDLFRDIYQCSYPSLFLSLYIVPHEPDIPSMSYCYTCYTDF